MYKNLPRTRYQVIRSRNNGEYWVEIYLDLRTSEEAEELLKAYHEKHPSDWLKIIKTEVSEIKAVYGNKKKNIGKREDGFKKLVKEMIRLGITTPLEEKYDMEKVDPPIMPENVKDDRPYSNIVHPELLNI